MMSMVLLASCGGGSGQFRLEGRLRNMNVGEFWVYSPDGGISGIDTIAVREGRFAYECPLSEHSTLVVVFPNFSVQPVFAEPGAKVTIKGDATHLREMTIEGTDNNETMTQLRMDLNKLTPREGSKAVEQFIRENTESPLSVYLLQHYFIEDSHADLRKARQLAGVLLKGQETLSTDGKATPELGVLTRLSKELNRLQGGIKGTMLPVFTATDVKGRKVSEQQLDGKVNVITAWAAWSPASNDMLRRLERLKKQYGGQLGALSISLDGNSKAVRRAVERDSLPWSAICDGRGWDSPLLSKLGISDVPACIVTDSKRRIVARDLTPQQMEDEINKRLK